MKVIGNIPATTCSTAVRKVRPGHARTASPRRCLPAAVRADRAAPARCIPYPASLNADALEDFLALSIVASIVVTPVSRLIACCLAVCAMRRWALRFVAGRLEETCAGRAAGRG